MLPLLAGAVAAFLAGLVLAAAALRIGWTDRVDAHPERKEAGAHVPLVGGAAVLVGAAAAGVAGAPLAGLPWGALIAAYALGLVDDLSPGGLAPAPKLACQAAVAALFAFAPGAAWAGGGTLAALGLFALAVASMNAVNLFDHADGMAGGQAGLALCGPAWPLAAGAVGYLPLNVLLRAPAPPGGGRARALALLGDSGAHMLGIAVAASPGAAILLLIPLLDAARVALSRWHRGAPPWRGDRTHLGHCLAALGLGRLTVPAVAWSLSLPLVGARAIGGAPPLLAGAALSTAAYVAVVRRTGGAA